MGFSKRMSPMQEGAELRCAETSILQQACRPRLGFLGVGWIGQHRLQALVRSGLVDVVAITDPVRMHAEQAARIAPGAAVLDSFETLLALEPGGLVIATPSALHAEQACAALT